MRYRTLGLAFFIGCANLANVPTPARATDNLLQRTVMGDISTSAADSVDLSEHWLSAGPIQAKLQDGQLRYIRVGDKEIVRRIYFGVRDGNWATAMPTYTLMKVENASDHFTVNMAAHCKMGKVDYSWTGTITGTADGKITFEATGTPNADFESNRIGLCVLYGTPSLAGQEFETDGKPSKNTFPLLVSPVHIADQFHKLWYTTANGLSVSCSAEGSIFDMEDQRNWGDSSWKAFAPLPYAYKRVSKGDVKTQVVTLMVTGVNASNGQTSNQDEARLEIGQPIPDAKMPKLIAADPGEKPIEYTTFSFAQSAYKDKEKIVWSYIPTTHLPDNDVIMENLPALADQAKTIRSVAPRSQLTVSPIHLTTDGKDPRSNTPIGAAWSVGIVNSLARGGVPEGNIELKGDIVDAALDAVRPYAGWPLMAIETTPKIATHILAYGCFSDSEQVVFIVNLGSHPTKAELGGIAGNAKVLHVAPGAKEESIQAAADGLKLELKPYEVVRVTLARAASGK